jgi:hypothetical protein
VNQPVYDPAPGSRPPLRGGLLLLLDIFSAPKRAFATIGQTREWLPAFILVAALGVAGSLLLAPALEHLIGVQAAANPGGASSAADLSRMTGYEVADVIIWQTLGQVMLWVWTAVILAGVAGSGPKTFGLYFALAANVALPAAVGFFISSCVIALHDPHAYANIAQLNRAFPDSLAIFEPRDNDRAVTFLASFDLFGLWSTLLLAFGLRALGKVELFWALIAAFTLWLAFALLQMVAGF